MPKKILIVDDEKDVRESTMRLLLRKGYYADGAESGIDALEKIREESFDLLIVDIRMPGMDGIEMLRRVKEINPEIIAIILTGHGTVDREIEAKQLGAVGFLRKPTHIDNLTKAIDNALAKRFDSRNS